MELSIFLAKILGPLFTIMILGALANRALLNRMVDEAENNISLTYLSGSLALLIGLLLVISHNVWETNWRVFITLIGWISIIKGLIRIFAPNKVVSIWRSIMSGGAYKIILIIFLIIGLILTYQGYWG